MGHGYGYTRGVTKLLVLALVLGACGDDDGGGATVDAAPTVDAISPDAPADAPPAAKEGQVLITEVHSNPETSIAVAMFADGPLYVTTASADGCDAIANMPATSLSAGTITVTGTTSDVALAQLGDDAPYIPTEQTPADLFAAGATLTVTATGDVVPAFTGDVVAPEQLADMVFPASISRAAPAAFTWTAGDGDAMWIVVTSATSTPGGMLCKATDTGSFTLTTDAIGLLPPTLTQLTVIAYRIKEVPVAAGPWTVFLRVGDGALAETTPIGP